MLILKVIIFTLALFMSLLYINNVIADIASLISWGTTFHSEEEIKDKEKVGINFAKTRLILAVVVSLLWGIFIVIF